MSQFELVGLVDPVPERNEFFRQEFNLSPAVGSYGDLSACLEQLDFDAVAVFTPDGLHAEVVVPALDAGKFVFVEKPLETTEEKLDAIVAADERAGGRTFVGFNLRFAPVYAKLYELLQAGVAGRVLTIQADEFYSGGRTYFRRWNRLQSMGGGLWITKASHDFDLLYWMAGAEPRSVFAVSALSYYKPKPEAAMYCRDCKLEPDCPDSYRQFPPGERAARLVAVTEKATGQKFDLCLYNSDKDTFDNGAATVTFANGVIATYTVNVVAGFSGRRMRVSGTRATIDADLNSPTITIRHRDPSRDEIVEVGGIGESHGGADQFILDAFADFCQGRPTRAIRPREAAVAVRMGLAATASSQRNAPVAIG